MTVFIDTSVFMYAGGGDHPLREPCREVLRQVAAGRLSATTSVEVVQEILHRFARGRRDAGPRMAADVLGLFGQVLPVDTAVVRDVVARYRGAPTLSARDAVHVATCLANGIDRIVSADRGFDAVDEVVRLAPSDVADGAAGTRE